jgi:hypothetical protein
MEGELVLYKNRKGNLIKKYGRGKFFIYGKEGNLIKKYG